MLSFFRRLLARFRRAAPLPPEITLHYASVQHGLESHQRIIFRLELTGPALVNRTPAQQRLAEVLIQHTLATECRQRFGPGRLVAEGGAARYRWEQEIPS